MKNRQIHPSESPRTTIRNNIDREGGASKSYEALNGRVAIRGTSNQDRSMDLRAKQQQQQSKRNSSRDSLPQLGDLDSSDEEEEEGDTVKKQMALIAEATKSTAAKRSSATTAAPITMNRPSYSSNSVSATAKTTISAANSSFSSSGAPHQEPA